MTALSNRFLESTLPTHAICLADKTPSQAAYSAAYCFWKIQCRLIKLSHQLRRLKQQQTGSSIVGLE